MVELEIPDELDAALTAAHADMLECLAGLKTLEAAIREKKELQRCLLDYIGTKPARDGLKAQKSDKARRAYREGAGHNQAASQQSLARRDRTGRSHEAGGNAGNRLCGD